MYRICHVARAAGLGALAAALAGCAPDAPVRPGTAPSFDAAASSRPPFIFPAGCCYFQGQVVRTVVPPASDPQAGIDNFYGFPASAAAGQKGVVAVAPGAPDYHGGHWKFFAVTWNVTPYLLTSETAVLAAAAVGDATVTRVPESDFKCPIQP
jgi:hypothetical protein